MQGIFGVSIEQDRAGFDAHGIQQRQKPMLYVYDPKALHTIVVKQQDIFEKAESTVR